MVPQLLAVCCLSALIAVATGTEWEKMPAPNPDLAELSAEWQQHAAHYDKKYAEWATQRRALKAAREAQGNPMLPETSLGWFMRHQSPNGAWDSLSYGINCDRQGPKAQPENDAGQWGVNGEQRNVMLTAGVLLCYLGAGYDHRTPNKYRRVVKGGLDWLMEYGGKQDVKFLFTNHYAQAFATMALAEAYAMTVDPDLKKPAQQAVDALLSTAVTREHELLQSVAGWPTKNGSNIIDLQATLVATMALKSAKAGGLNTHRSLIELKNWYQQLITHADEARKDNNSIALPLRSTIDHSRMFGEASEAGLALGVFLGIHPDTDPLILAVANRVAFLQLPHQRQGAFEQYVATLGLFQIGPPWWKTCGPYMRYRTVAAQNVDGNCLEGSWQADPLLHSTAGAGRLTTSIFEVLKLEIFYRYDWIRKR